MAAAMLNNQMVFIEPKPPSMPQKIGYNQRWDFQQFLIVAPTFSSWKIHPEDTCFKHSHSSKTGHQKALNYKIIHWFINIL